MKDSIQFLIILFLFGLLFMQQCKQNEWSTNEIKPSIDTIVKIDTTLPPPIIVHLPRQKIPAPTIIYIDSSKNVVLAPDVDPTRHMTANIYQDSLEDENLTLYYSSIVNGELLKNNLDYKLKIPKLITKMVEISKPYPMPVSSLMLTGAVGGNMNQFASVRLGLEFVSKKGWSLGYDYDLLQNVHSVNFGVQLIQFKDRRSGNAIKF